MTSNKTPVTWPLSPAEWAAVERAARQERARAMSAFGRSVVALTKRAFGIGKPITIWVPAVKGGRITA